MRCQRVMRSAAWVALLAGALLLGLAAHRRSLALAKTLERDVYALIALHEEVKDRDPQWRGAMDKWPVHTCNANGTCGVDPCGMEWEGDGWEGVSCRYQWNWDPSIPRVVTNLHLPKRQLTGPMPRALALLANVTELDMDTNFIAGPLPAEWGCLKELIEIDFSDNLLTGTVPLEWGLMSNLVELEVDGNAGLGGCMPDGTPPFDRLCGTRWGPPCPSFTTDRMIGSATRGTRIRGRCEPFPGGPAALAAGLRCPKVEDFRGPIAQFFERQQQQQPTQQQVQQAQQGQGQVPGGPSLAQPPPQQSRMQQRKL